MMLDQNLKSPAGLGNLPAVCTSDDLLTDDLLTVEAEPVFDGRAGNKSSVAMSIVTSGLQFRLDTVVDHSHEAVELAAKLDLALSLLSQSENKLAAAMIAIGHLQAQLTAREAEAHEP